MSNRKSIKVQITELVLAEIPKDQNPYCDSDTDQLLIKWWYTGRQSGLRLTDNGFNAFALAQIEHYDVNIRNSISGRSYYEFVLELSKKIKCPYYLSVNKTRLAENMAPYVRLYDSKIAMMINLYGNLREYLDSVRIK